MRIPYLRDDEFQVQAVTDEQGKLNHWIVVDRNEELVIDKKFRVASEAIIWGQENFKGLVK